MGKVIPETTEFFGKLLELTFLFSFSFFFFFFFFFYFYFFFFFFFFFGNRCSVWGTITLLFWFCMAVILNFQSCRQLRNISSFFPFCLHFFLYKKGRFWKSVAIERVFHFSVCFHFTFISWRTFIRTLQMYVVDVCCGMLFTSYRRRLVL